MAMAKLILLALFMLTIFPIVVSFLWEVMNKLPRILSRKKPDSELILVGATRLKLRNILWVPIFNYESMLCIIAAGLSKGYISGRTRRDGLLLYSTVSLWQTKKDLDRFRNTSVHRLSARHSLEYTCELTTHSWLQHGLTIPSWEEIYAKLFAEGKAIRLKHPSRRQVDRSWGIYPPQSNSWVVNKLLIKELIIEKFFLRKE